MLIKILKSHDMWEDDCTGWYDLYSVDDVQVYPTSDYDDTPVPSWVFEKFEETLNGSKMEYSDMVLALYYDLYVFKTERANFDLFLEHNMYTIIYLEKILKDELNLVIEVV